jgi:hypothetical protein
MKQKQRVINSKHRVKAKKLKEKMQQAKAAEPKTK